MSETGTYQPQAEDTAIEVDCLLFKLLRQQPVRLRLARAAQHSRSINTLSLSGVKRRNPDASKPEIRQKFAIAKLRHIPSGLTFTGEDEAMWVQDSISLAKKLHHIFQEHEILYYVTGGVAASTYGEPRSTVDLDLVVQLGHSDVEALASLLTEQGFYCPEGAVNEAKSGTRRFLQAIYQTEISTVDIYLSDNSEFAMSELARRLWIEEGFYVASAEDTILQKLKWRQKSQAEKQWRDVLGILKLQQSDLDYEYLHDWAERLGLTSDLERSLQAAGG